MGKNVLILTLYSGEHEFESCLRSVNVQSYEDREQRVFKNLPNSEAHELLYRTIMTDSRDYDLFFKLDADMVLADSEVLSDLVRVFEGRPDLDHLVVAVTDWMTDDYMIGAHLFSNRVSWRHHHETLYVDPDPAFPGCKLTVDKPARDLILHSSDPEPLQAFHFGAHRGLQAAQVYRRLGNTRPHNARVQWQYLDRVWRHYERSQDPRLGLAILAADMVFRKELPETANEYADPALLEAFEEVSALDDSQLYSRLESRWATPEARRRTWRSALGPAKAWLVFARGLRDAVARAVKGRMGRSSPPVEIGTRA